jgi:hypothetical protein
MLGPTSLKEEKERKVKREHGETRGKPEGYKTVFPLRSETSVIKQKDFFHKGASSTLRMSHINR